jgi:hypothetical protein
MAWVNLQNSLGSRARVVAGPVLRRVTPTSVTVWLAMRVGATVTLTILDEQGNQRMTGARRSLAIGANLHIVAVTATPNVPFADLSEGNVYRYNLSFVFDDGAPGTLAAATNGASLAYPPYDLPSFALPPKDLTLLRLLQGSCRKPHAGGAEALSIADGLINDTVTNGFARPHQLLLGGDQIYADDVAPIMLTMLTDAATALLGWTEVLPVPAAFGTFNTIAQLDSFMRRRLLDKEGFTSEDLDSHLMGLGEYLAMYLFVWSPELWPRGNLPQLVDIRTDVITKWRALLHLTDSPLGGLPPGIAPMDLNDKIEATRANMENFRSMLPTVRRVLANVPSYMIFDDHEITDDWNMTREFCRKVYASPLGQRIVQNGLVAYAFCQHWGNVPEDFAPATPATPGTTLYALVDTPNPTAAGAFAQKATDYNTRSSQIRSLVGLHDAFALDARTDNAVFHDALSLQYHYSVVGPGHQVIVTDTRTWRAYPTDSDKATHLLTKNAQADLFKKQIVDAPDPQDRQLLVVVSTNAPPVQPIRSATTNFRLTNAIKHFPDVFEAWDLPSVSFDRLLSAVTSKLPLDVSGKRTGSVILLSGDVHFAFASRIIYRATNRFEDTTPQPTAAVVAQLVASALKNQSDGTKDFHRDGYFAHPFPTGPLIRKARTEGYVGWNLPNSGIRVGSRFLGVGNLTTEEFIILKALTTVDVTPIFTNVRIVRQPDYRYRLDYLAPTAQTIEFPRPSIPPLPSGTSTPEQRRQAARSFDAASDHFRKYNKAAPPEVVGLNNLGEMRFEGATAATRKVNHLVRWLDPESLERRQTTYTVRLDVNGPTDSQYPDVPPSGVTP